MRRLILLPILFLLTSAGYAGNFQLPFPLNDEQRTVFFNVFQDCVRELTGISEFNRNRPDSIVSGTLEFKISRKTPLIGTPPELKKPKFRKQKIQCSGALTSDGTIHIHINSQVYNRRDKQWYPVEPDLQLVDQILQQLLEKLWKNRSAWLLGDAFIPVAGDQSPLRGEAVFISDIGIRYQEIKSLHVQVQGKNDALLSLDIPFIGPVQTTADALLQLNRHLSWRDPLADIASGPAFFNPYAMHGELMDGMVPQQVEVALGKPDRISRNSDGSAIWFYQQANHEVQLRFMDGFLHFPD